MIVLIDGHPSLNIEFYIRKLIDDNIGISHLINKKNLNKSKSNIDDLLNINKCCNKFEFELDTNEIYLHNISPYSYRYLYSNSNSNSNSNANSNAIDNGIIDNMMSYLWKPDIIIYLFTSSINTNDEINLKYDIVYDDMICNYAIYKINCDDEPHIIYASICSIIKNNLIK
jgi:hypothetical protein